MPFQGNPKKTRRQRTGFQDNCIYRWSVGWNPKIQKTGTQLVKL